MHETTPDSNQKQYDSVLWQAHALAVIESVDQMSGGDFERYVIHLLKHQGYDSRQVGRSGDGGVDLIAVKDGVRHSIQCKRHQKRISRRAVSDAVGGLRQYDCSRAMVLTNSYLTLQAIQVAKANDCMIVDRNTLLTWIADFRRAVSDDPNWFKIADSELAKMAPPELPLPPDGATPEWVLHYLDSGAKTYDLAEGWRLFVARDYRQIRYRVMNRFGRSREEEAWLIEIGCEKGRFSSSYMLPLDGAVGVMVKLLAIHPIVKVRIRSP